jgi:nucleoside-diphosphate-sugar epimerase
VKTALVTGATGLVGTHVVHRLQRDGWDVRALVRDAARAGALSRAGVQLATGDILEPTSLGRAARGCDVIVHAAAAVTPTGGWEAFQRPNVEGTQNIITAATTANARLVHVSSVAVYGTGTRYQTGGAKTDEDTPLAPLSERSWYARSKRESEELVMSAHRDGRVWATAVRPDVIYGTHDRQFVPRIAKLLRGGIAPVVAGGRTTLAVVNATNVADGIVRAAQTDIAGGRAYNLANDYDVTVAEFFRLAAMGLEREIRIISVPIFAARALASAFNFVAPLFFGNRFSAVTSSSLNFISRDNPFTSERARRELGWDPPVRPEAGVPDAFAWWAAHH